MPILLLIPPLILLSSFTLALAIPDPESLYKRANHDGETEKKNLEQFGFTFGLSLLVIVLISVTTYLCFKCKRKRKQQNPTVQSTSSSAPSSSVAKEETELEDRGYAERRTSYIDEDAFRESLEVGGSGGYFQPTEYRRIGLTEGGKEGVAGGDGDSEGKRGTTPEEVRVRGKGEVREGQVLIAKNGE